jgi:hypothetical protein
VVKLSYSYFNFGEYNNAASGAGYLQGESIWMASKYFLAYYSGKLAA